MPNKNAFSAMMCFVIAGFGFLLQAGSAGAQDTLANYTFVIASGFLCDPADSGSCPAVAVSANGDSFEMSGAGIFDTRARSATAAGTFSHKSPNGTVLETGIWTASDLVSFDSYGIAPAAFLQRKMAAVGPSPIGYKGLPMRRGPMPAGGLATFHILLMPVSGTTRTAVLRVNCALGNVPREHSVAGIQITVEKNDSQYSEQASGRVMFLALRHGVAMPAVTPEQGANTAASEPSKQ